MVSVILSKFIYCYKKLKLTAYTKKIHIFGSSLNFFLPGFQFVISQSALAFSFYRRRNKVQSSYDVTKVIQVIRGKTRTQASWLHSLFLMRKLPSWLKKEGLWLWLAVCLFANLRYLFLEHWLGIWLLSFCKVIALRDSVLKSGGNPGQGCLYFLRWWGPAELKQVVSTKL